VVNNTEDKVKFLKQHKILAKEVFDKEKANKDVKKLFIKLCKKELKYSKKTSDIDIYVGMRGAWVKLKGGKI